MGFFRSVRELQKQGNEINKNWDVGAQLAGAQASMQAAQATMAQQTQAANIAATGLDATATISAVRQSGGMVNYQPMLDIDVIVMAPGRPPMPATVSGVVEQLYLHKAQPGAQVPVKVDPADPSVVWINWAAAPVAPPAAPPTGLNKR